MNPKSLQELLYLIDDISAEIDVWYKGYGYLLSKSTMFGGIVVLEDQASFPECRFNTIEEFAEKATIGGDLLKDVFDDLAFEKPSVRSIQEE